MNDSVSGPIFFVVAASAIAIIVLFVMPSLDRRRIREHIESHGGKVIEILRDWFGWGSRSATTYDVTYLTSKGERITATCMTSMMGGVQWISNRPPGSITERGEASEDIEPRGETEPIDCVECGARIAPEEASCPQCGWSYKKHAPSGMS